MTASLITGLILFFCLLQLVSADPQKQHLTAQPGDDVTLPCRAPNYVTIAAVKWTISDLKKRVFLKSDGHLKTDDQDPSYVNRVQLKDDEMKNGDLSLILKNVNNNDTGTYKCRYVEDRGRRRKRSVTDDEPISIVQLNVEDEPGPGPGPGPLVIILSVAAAAAAALAVAVGGGFMIYKKLKGRSENNSDLRVDDPEGQKLQVNENSDKETPTDNK